METRDNQATIQRPDEVADVAEGDEVTLTITGEADELLGRPVYPEDRIRVEMPDGRTLSVHPDMEGVEIDGR